LADASVQQEKEVAVPRNRFEGGSLKKIDSGGAFGERTRENAGCNEEAVGLGGIWAAGRGRAAH